MALAIHREEVPIRKRLQRSVDGFQKIVAMRLNVEPDEIGSQQAIDQLALPRTDSEDFRIGPGNVPEDGHTRVGACFLHHSRQQCEVIVLR